MSEFNRGTTGDDEFDKLMAGLEADEDFSSIIGGIDDDMDMADFATLSAGHVTAAERYAIPHTEVPLEVGDKIVDAFGEICKEHGVDPNLPPTSVAQYNGIGEDLAAEVYGLKKEIWAGDVITATDALLVDMGNGEDDCMHVVGVFGGDKVVGTFSTPVVGPMPDETHAIMLQDTVEPAMGVGLVLESPVIIDANGDVHTDVFEGRGVIVSLGVAGTKLTKYRYPAGFND